MNPAIDASLIVVYGSWNWGSGQPSGTVKDVKEEETEIKSKNNKPVSASLPCICSCQLVQAGYTEAFPLLMLSDQEEGR